MVPEALEALRVAINSHVPERIAGCFTDDYVAERPLKPHEGFIGSERVAANWRKILAGLPDLRAEILRHAQNGDELWSEWEMRGTAATGATVVLRGPVVLTTRDGRIAWARFYPDPVTTNGPAHTTVSRVLTASAERIFAVLRDPRRHPELDATGFRGHAETPGPIDAVGDTFVMAMHNDEQGDYRVENRVVAFTEDRVIGWESGRSGQRLAGHRFVWKLTPTDDGRTEVTLTYDWAAVTDPAEVPRLPLVSAAQLEASLEQLAAVVA
ncbi:nuclear transport factor 2 family protein [Kibdelosporangium persicum]|uniref:Polyketide cyclase / dehydrase and lipid transport n=1 Tax=Kibdelosporangium persicum TaxID=2698649 RepID=A0ABX2F959_9PSEU|nr:nuclear transport factor 2 family protein [Kibdelosporangium persicum]NRN67900.1 Polyketide cyclase / dehydrase and lipid transport [Kibdelosporangium persicum]